jgi:hypothetical protein
MLGKPSNDGKTSQRLAPMTLHFQVAKNCGVLKTDGRLRCGGRGTCQTAASIEEGSVA